jgi:hypothetical protein
MSIRLGAVIRRVWLEAVSVFLLGAAILVFMGGVVPPYPAFVAVPGGGVLTVWCLNSVFWHWNELKPGERLARLFLGGLLGPAFVAEGLSQAREAPLDVYLYAGTLAAGLLLAGVMEVLLSLFRHSGPPPAS